jgi:putative ABC transport system permease protein
MITGYKQLTGRYLKASKKRTVLTILAIILSIALISSIGLFLVGMQEAEIQKIKRTKGSYHLMFMRTDEEMAEKVINNPNVSRYGFFSIGQEIKVGEKLVVNEYVATDRALELLPANIKKGTLPRNQKEVAMEQWVLKQIDPHATVGDKIKLNNKEYTVSGILDNDIENQISNKGILLSKNNQIDKKHAALLVEISPKANLRATVNELKKLSGKNPVKLNIKLLTLQGAGGDSEEAIGLYATVVIIIGIVVISTIAVIYNSFQISVVERVKQFGLLRAVGATPKQMRRIVTREATFLSLIGIPLGLLCGIIAIYGIFLAFKLIAGDLSFPMQPVISPKVLVISAGVGLVSIYLSTWLPAYSAGKISPLAAISSRTMITKDKIKRSKSGIIGKLFGFEGVLAEKNIKRNRKRYRITVFSIVISVTLFITFKSFVDMTLTLSEDANESKNVHFSVLHDAPGAELPEIENHNIINHLKSLKAVDKVYRVYAPYRFVVAIDKNSELKQVQDIGGIYKTASLQGTKKTLVSGVINIYDHDSLQVSKKYLQSGSIDEEELNKENGVIIIKKSTIYNAKTKKNYIGPIASLRIGDEIYLQEDTASYRNRIELDKGKVKKVKVMAIVETDPFNFRGAPDGLKMITTEEVAKNLTEKNEVHPVQLNVKLKSAENENIARKQIESAIKSDPSLKIINNIDQNRKNKSSILMIQILIYGFVVVVSLIGSVNIINTLTTNILLRKREFASLKAIGLTQKGLRKIITLEGILYGIVGTVYGSIIGCILSFLMYKFLIGINEFAWKFPWDAILIAGFSAIIIAYVSVLPPLARMKKENLIEAIKEDY